jgi:hypothetical protein
MHARTLVRALLLAVVFGSLAVFAWQRSQRASVPSIAEPEPSAPAAEVIVDPEKAADVVVTYFTTNVRCVSCRTIEELTRRAVAEGFASELAAGRVVFRVVNTDLPEHQHFLEQYSITNKIVIVSHQREGNEVEWSPRQDVWTLFHDPEAFLAYVREPIAGYLAAR